MNNKNRVELRGFLGDNPELTAGVDGLNSRCVISLATNYKYLDKATNTTKTKTEWHRVIAWGKTGENAAKYLIKGSEAEVIGRLSTRSYEEKGQTRYITEVIASEIEYGSRPAAKTESTPEAAPAVQRTTVRRRENEVTASSNFESEEGDPF